MDYRIIENAEPFDIIFKFNKESLLNKLIWYFSTNKNLSKFNHIKKTAHVMIYLGYGILAEVNLKGLGVRSVPKFSDKKYTISVGRIDKEFDRQLAHVLLSKAIYNKVPYDYARLFLYIYELLFKKTVNDYSKKAMVCSEFVTAFFKTLGVDLSDRDPCHTTPLGLYQSPLIRYITLD